jgi:hypothetical protein
MKSPSELIEVWWSVAINVPKKCCHFESFVFGEYFLKANNRENKIFPINDRFCDLYIKNILIRYSEFNPIIIRALFFDISREMIFQLIKIIGELHYVLIKSLARIRIPLLIFDLKIKIVIEDILEIRYIKFPIDGNIFPIIYFFFKFLYIDWSPVEINFNKINSNFFYNVITAIIIKLIIILSFINSEIMIRTLNYFFWRSWQNILQDNSARLTMPIQITRRLHLTYLVFFELVSRLALIFNLVKWKRRFSVSWFKLLRDFGGIYLINWRNPHFLA